MPSNQKLEGTVRPVKTRVTTVFDPHGGLGGSGTFTSVSVYPFDIHTKVIERVWDQTPGYRAKLKAKESLPDLEYSYFENNWDTGTSINATKHQGGTYVDNDQNWPYSIDISEKLPNAKVAPSAPNSQVTFSEVASKVLSKAKGNQFNVPIFAGEGGKTASMVVDRATSLVKMMRSLRKGRFNEFLNELRGDKPPRKVRRSRERFNRDWPKDPSRAAANAWLEWTYGWTPFMQDCKSAVHTLMDVVDQPSSQTARVTASVRKDRVLTESHVLLQVSPAIYGDVQQQISDSRRMVWRCAPGPGALPARFGLTNPAEVAWELVPFSFVADWFLPIGDYLSALDAPMVFSHLGGTTGTRVVNFVTFNCTSYDGFDSISGGGFSRAIRVKRDPLHDIPTPSLSDIALQCNMGAKRVTSAISLLRQNIPRTFGRR